VLALAWDTSTPSLSLALARIDPSKPFEPGILALEAGSAPSTHSSKLPSLAASVLGDHGLAPSDLRLVAAGRGPGSFTGLRVGLSFAKGLAFGGVPALGVPSLAALAMAPGAGEGLLAPVIDARHGELFAQFHRVRPGAMPEPLGPILVLRPAAFFAALRAALGEIGAADGPVTVLGPGVALLPPFEEDFLRGPEAGPSAISVAVIGAMLLNAGGPAAHPPHPLYGRGPEIFKSWTPPSRLAPAG
jgi:tRNA threonylcarbamoyladenosine biosynthesis protein TsaB